METKTSLNLNKYKQPILTVEEGMKLLLLGKTIDNIQFVNSDDIKKYNDMSENFELEKLTVEQDTDLDYKEYHLSNSENWNIPEKYKNINVLEYCIGKCNTEKEIERVCEEYILFQERDLIPLLQTSIFFVDYMREHKYVWGVGRGSSVSSFCLYLIGVHRINSLEYDLPIKEFLK